MKDCGWVDAEVLDSVAVECDKVEGSVTLLSFKEVIGLVRRVDKWAMSGLASDRMRAFEYRCKEFSLELSLAGGSHGKGTIQVSSVGQVVARYADKDYRGGPIERIALEIMRPQREEEERKRKQRQEDERRGVEEAARKALAAAEELRNRFEL